MHKNSSPKKPAPSLWKYASLTTQFFIIIGITMYLGWWIDRRLSLQFPIAIWTLPLLAIIVIIIKIIKDTNHTTKL